MKGEIIYLLHSIVHTILHMAAPLCIYELLGREKVKKATTQHSKCWGVEVIAHNLQSFGNSGDWFEKN